MRRRSNVSSSPKSSWISVVGVVSVGFFDGFGG